MSTNTTTTRPENIAADTLLGLGNALPNTDTVLHQQENDEINPRSQVPFSPQHMLKYIGEKDNDGKKHGKNGIYLFKKNDMHMLYVGEFKHGNSHGEGTLYQNIDGRDLGLIDGMEAVKKMTFSNGIHEESRAKYAHRYEGTWNGQFSLKGKGKYHDRDRSITGTFVTENAKYQFKGKVGITYLSNDTFEGYLYPHDGFNPQVHPQQGLYTYMEGHTYRGTFPNTATDQLDHKGTYVDADGSTYTGDFRKDKKHGKGVLLFENGNRFSGQFENDIPVYGIMEKCISSTRKVKYTGDVNKKFESHGNGSMVEYVNGEVASTYEGEFDRDKKHGKGTATIRINPEMLGEYREEGKYDKGSLKEGEVIFKHATDPTLNFKKQGRFGKNGNIRKGIYTHPNGDEYHGHFDVNGQASGKGTLFKENATYNGKWKNDKKNGQFDYMKRISNYYIHSTNAMFENDVVVQQQHKSRKRKADFKQFTRVCRQRVGSN